MFWFNMKVSMTCMLPTQTPKEETKSRLPPFYGYSLPLTAVFCTVGWAHVVQITLNCGDICGWFSTSHFSKPWSSVYVKRLRGVLWEAAIYSWEGIGRCLMKSSHIHLKGLAWPRNLLSHNIRCSSSYQRPSHNGTLHHKGLLNTQFR